MSKSARKQLTFGSLFSGIGGLDLGLERAGMECRWQVEIDDYASRVLAARWPSVRRLRDVRDVSSSTVEAVDVICGGFPCQPVSLAGKRKSQGDHRWLWPEYARVVDELRPGIVVVENVPGLLSLGGTEVVTDFASIGYDCHWDDIPAAAFGLPQPRWRIFIVAYPVGSRLAKYMQHYCESKTYFTERQAGWNYVDGLAEAENKSQNAAGIICGMDDGPASRVDRLRCLGNAVVPQVAEYIGRLIMESIEWH